MLNWIIRSPFLFGSLEMGIPSPGTIFWYPGLKIEGWKRVRFSSEFTKESSMKTWQKAAANSKPWPFQGLSPKSDKHQISPYRTHTTPRVSYGDIIGDSDIWVYGWNPIVLPFKRNLFSSTFTWHFLYFSILQMKFGIRLEFWLLGTLGSERVNQNTQVIRIKQKNITNDKSRRLSKLSQLET